MAKHKTYISQEGSISSQSYRFVRNMLKKLTQLSVNKRFKSPINPISITKSTLEEYNRSRDAIYLKYLCHAPFTNMYFSYGGKMGVCCYNRSHLLGTWPDTGIMQAWKSTNLQQLRQKMKHCDLTSGCYCCQVQWEEKAYTTVLARNYDYFKPTVQFPVSMEFELSNRCNLECVMCSEENSSKIAKIKLGEQEKLLPYNHKFVEELRPFIPHLKSTKFMGGEPFLISIYYDIWDLITQINPNCEIVVQTNGSVLNNHIKQLLEKGNFSISISIDSVQKETYERIRKGATFEEVMNNIDYFIDLCRRKNRFIGIACCYIQQNWRELPAFIQFFNRRQIPVTFNRVWSPPSCSIWESSYALTSEILQFYKNISLAPKTETERHNLAAFNDLIHLTESWNEHEKQKLNDTNRFSDFSTEQIEQQVMAHILNISSIQETELHNQEAIKTKFENTMYVFRQRKNYRELLIKALHIPTEILYTQILNSSEEKLIARLDELDRTTSNE